jgi:Fe2+ transport system protein B
MSNPFMRMWGAPIALAALTIIGLISALVGDGVWDHVSAVALGVPVLLCLWFGLRRRTKSD